MKNNPVLGTLRPIATAGISILLCSAAQFAHAAPADAIEVFSASTKQYALVTPLAGTPALTHNGITDWAATGNRFSVSTQPEDIGPSAKPVCGFLNAASNQFYWTASASDCSSLRSNSAWQYLGIGFYADTPTNSQCGNGFQPVYQTSGKSGYRWFNQLPGYQTSLDQGEGADGVAFCVPGISTTLAADSIRLLQQATFGADQTTFDRLMAIGMDAWLDEQFSAPVSRYADLPWVSFTPTDECKSDVRCLRDNYTLFPTETQFLQQALTASDQLRQRVAFALSQILVTSGVKIRHPYGMNRYQQILRDLAFGNFRDVLTQVTLSPVMGRYLDMANSNKPTATMGANENYAREFMQLFSLGLYALNADGSIKRDAKGLAIPAYTQEDVEGLASVFTGWTFAPLSGGNATRNDPVNYLLPMQAVQRNHDTNSKILLDRFTIPAGQSAEKDLADAIGHIFSHANVGPFISRQLIQKLVTGDPSPAYVARVAAVFNDNGKGVRGDLKAVVRAILKDEEARGEIKTAAGYGHLREPVLMVTSLIRGLGGRSDGVALARLLGDMGQNLFNSPTVFNYYSPSNTISDGKVGPEFQILNAATVFARANFANTLIMGNGIAADPLVDQATGTQIDWAHWQALASNPPALLNLLNWTFAAGSLSLPVQTTILSAVNAVSDKDLLTRAKTAAYLVVNASPSQIIR